jgi:endonuclease YncB( thermonuclease family)
LVIPPGPAVIIRQGTRVIREVPSPKVKDVVLIPTRQFVPSEAHRVVRVDDRFLVTLLIDGVETPVRMVGVDPPLVATGEGLPKPPEEARQFIENLLAGELVYLDRDPILAQKDAEGNLVAYLYRAPDKLLINLELIRQGYGLVAEDYKFRFEQAFLAQEQKARAARRGIWALTFGTDL